MGSTARIRQFIFKTKAVLCVLLVLNLHAWIAGCTGPAGIAAPLTGILRIELSADHALTKALNNSVLIGAEAFEIDPVRKSFRIIFAEENREVTGTYAVIDGAFTITKFTFGRLGRSVTMSLDLSKRVRTIVTDDGFAWQRPANWPLVGPSSDGVEGYVEANAQLLDIAKGVDQGQTPNPGNDTTNPGSGGDFDAELSALVGNKINSADADLLLLILGTILAIWGPILGILSALLSIFLVIALIQSLVGDLDGSPPGQSPFPDDQQPPVDPVPPNGGTPTDCNDNGVSDITDIADGTAQDSNGNAVPDACEAQACCLADDSCSEILAADCSASGGTPQGTDTTCDAAICDDSITLSVTGSVDWVYEHLIFEGSAATNCETTFTADVENDPLGNSGYTYVWMITPPSNRAGAAFTAVSGDTTASPTFLPPDRPASSANAYVVTVFATGNDHGNTGSAATTIEVRLLGDADNSGCVDQADIDFVDQVEAGNITDEEMIRQADVNCDGVMDFISLDVRLIDFVRQNLDGQGNGACD